MSSDPITQNRLSMRLARYMNDYTVKAIKDDNPYKEGWNAAYKTADVARVNNNLTPEIIDDVRIALNKL
jgi:hypothetical protein